MKLKKVEAMTKASNDRALQRALALFNSPRFRFEWDGVSGLSSCGPASLGQYKRAVQKGRFQGTYERFVWNVAWHYGRIFAKNPFMKNVDPTKVEEMLRK